MSQHALDVLEFSKILQLYASHCETGAGRQRATETQPSFDAEKVWAEQALTSEAWELLERGLPTLAGFHDMTPQVGLCAKGGVAQGVDLYRVGQALGVMRSAREKLLEREEIAPRIAQIAFNLADEPGLEAELNRCLDGGGDVLDEASTELAVARARIGRTSQRMLAAVQAYLTGRTRDLLSDPVYTTRAGRFVIPLKAENKGKIRGIVHDTSATGQTLFIEPDDVVALGNQLREAEAQERHEVERVLKMLSGKVGAIAREFTMGAAAVIRLDTLFARARFGAESHGCLAQPLQGPQIELKEARHPLLPRSSAVPLSLKLGGGTDALLITGPNTGGKTVAIKTVGLAVLMVQSGLMPLAAECKCGCFSQVWADIGDEQSLQQSLSTFSGHVKNIVAALKGLKPGALILLDEVGAGTDPAEGAALARAVLLEFQERGAVTMASTHYGELKVLATNQEGFQNASMEFDLKSLRPTYRLILGTPGSSHALKIAQKYGMPEHVVEIAAAGYSIGEQDIALMLERLESTQKRASKAQSEADRLTHQLRRLEEETDKKLREAEESRRKVRERVAGELEEVMRMIRLEAADVFEEIKRKPTQANLDSARKKLAEIQEVGQAFVAELRPAPPKRPETTLAEITRGMTVSVAGFEQKGTVVEDPRGKNVLVQVGSLKMHVPVHRLTPVGTPKPTTPKHHGRSSVLAKAQTVRGEIVLIEMRAEQAAETLERYLDDAVLGGLDSVRIVHGKGEGILRKVTQETLRRHPGVKSYREAAADEGGHGVTIATLKD